MVLKNKTKPHSWSMLLRNEQKRQGFNLTKMKIPDLQEKIFPTLCSLSNLGSNLIYAR